MRLVDLSMTVEECDSTPFAKEEAYFKSRPIVRWEDKGFVSSMVEMTVHAGTHIDSPHHFFRDKPSVEQLPLESMIGEAVVLDLTFKGSANARITIVHNGVVIHDNFELPHSTPGALDEKEGEPGSLLLQDHGNPVQYRNLWVKRL